MVLFVRMMPLVCLAIIIYLIMPVHYGLWKNFVDKGIPVIIGEYAASGSDLSSCIFFIEKLNKLCSDYGIATFIWDNGRQVNRKTYKWRTPQYLEALKRATSGKDYEVVKE